MQTKHRYGARQPQSTTAVARIVHTNVDSANSNQCAVINKAGVETRYDKSGYELMRRGKKVVLWVLLMIGCSNIIKVGVKGFLCVLTQSDLYIVTDPKRRQFNPFVFGKAFCIVFTVQSNKKGDL